MEFLVALLSGVVSTVTDVVLRRRRIQVLVHRAIFLPTSSNATPPVSGSADSGSGSAPHRDVLTGPSEQVFVKVINRSRADVEITHIWFATTPPTHLLNDLRRLPARVRPDETFETWVPAAGLAQQRGIENLARVRLSTGGTVKSRPNKDVPAVGYVAGGGSEQSG